MKNPSEKRAMRSLMLGIGLALVAGSFSCISSRLKNEDLPERPIAFLHWADKAGQKRGEIFGKAGEVPPQPPDKFDPERLDEMHIRAQLRGDEMLALRPELEKHPGRLMLVWPRTGEMQRIDAAPRNAIPLAWSPDGRRLLMASSHRGA